MPDTRQLIDKFIKLSIIPKDPDKFEEVYQHGVADAEQSMADLSVYLTTNPKD